jgi:hypothetical protein
VREISKDSGNLPRFLPLRRCERYLTSDGVAAESSAHQIRRIHQLALLHAEAVPSETCPPCTYRLPARVQAHHIHQHGLGAVRQTNRPVLRFGGVAALSLK